MWGKEQVFIMFCPKCRSNNIKVSDTNIASLGLGAAKGLANAGYWGFKVVSKIDNIDLPDQIGFITKLGSATSRIIAGTIKAGADAIPENAIKFQSKKCGYTWYDIYK